MNSLLSGRFSISLKSKFFQSQKLFLLRFVFLSVRRLRESRHLPKLDLKRAGSEIFISILDCYELTFTDSTIRPSHHPCLARMLWTFCGQKKTKCTARRHLSQELAGTCSCVIELFFLLESLALAALAACELTQSRLRVACKVRRFIFL